MFFRRALKSWFQGTIFTCLGMLAMTQEPLRSLWQLPQSPRPVQAQMDRPLPAPAPESAEAIVTSLTLPNSSQYSETLPAEALTQKFFSPREYFNPKIPSRNWPIIAFTTAQHLNSSELIRFFEKCFRLPEPKSPAARQHHQAALSFLIAEMAQRNQSSFIPTLMAFRRHGQSPALVALSSLALEAIKNGEPEWLEQTQKRWLKSLLSKMRTTAEANALKRIDSLRTEENPATDLREKVRSEFNVKPSPEFGALENQFVQAVQFLKLVEFEAFPHGIVNNDYSQYLLDRTASIQFQESDKNRSPNALMSLRPHYFRKRGDLTIYRLAKTLDRIQFAASLIHEGRHAEGAVHVDNKDKSYAAQGAYAAQVEFLLRLYLYGKNVSNFVRKISAYYALDLITLKFIEPALRPERGVVVVRKNGQLEIRGNTIRRQPTTLLRPDTFFFYNGYSLSLIPKQRPPKAQVEYFDLFSERSDLGTEIWTDKTPPRTHYVGSGTEALTYANIQLFPMDFRASKILDFISVPTQSGMKLLFLTDSEAVLYDHNGVDNRISSITFSRPMGTRLSVLWDEIKNKLITFITDQSGAVTYRLNEPWELVENQNYPDWHPELGTPSFPRRMEWVKPVQLEGKVWLLDRTNGRILDSHSLRESSPDSLREFQGDIKDAQEVELWNLPSLIQTR